MLNPKQMAYINLGLQDRFKCAYYYQHKENYFVVIDSERCEDANLPLYRLKFADNKKAEYFASRYIECKEYEFDVFTHKEDLYIEPRVIDGMLKIDCGQNEGMAKKMVKRFRTQYIEKLNRCKYNKSDDKKDFKGIQF